MAEATSVGFVQLLPGETCLKSWEVKWLKWPSLPVLGFGILSLTSARLMFQSFPRRLLKPSAYVIGLDQLVTCKDKFYWLHERGVVDVALSDGRRFGFKPVAASAEARDIVAQINEARSKVLVRG